MSTKYPKPRYEADHELQRAAAKRRGQRAELTIRFEGRKAEKAKAMYAKWMCCEGDGDFDLYAADEGSGFVIHADRDASTPDLVVMNAE